MRASLSSLLCLAVGAALVSGRMIHQKSSHPHAPANPTWQSVCVDHHAARKPSSLIAGGHEPSFLLQTGKHKGCIAWGYYDDQVTTTGWSYLFIETNRHVEDAIQARAAGFLEGSLTATRIAQWKVNSFYSMFNDSAPDVPLRLVYDWANKNQEWTVSELRKNHENPSHNHTERVFWNQVYLMQQQFDGVAEGFNHTITDPQLRITKTDLLLMNLNGDMDDITSIVQPSSFSALRSRSVHELLHPKQSGSRCSSLVRLTSSYKELFFAHVTWDTFNTMLRVFKLYKLNYHSAYNREIQFSGYPGVLYSTDDFYVLRQSKMSVTETTNTIYDNSYYNNIREGVTVWQRTMIANRLSSNNQEWSTYFSMYNSGTYNNQWILMDHKRFTSGSKPESGALFIVSQMPTQIHSLDVTDVLIQQGYWSSFNVPYFKDFFIGSGYQTLAQQYGDYYFGYIGNYRQLLFAREAPNVQTLSDMQRVMRLNKWQSDPLSDDNAMFAIASRYDLAQSITVPDFTPDEFGGLDCKIISHTDVLNESGNVVAISGPTYDDQPPFSFAAWPGVPILGMPQLFKFPWVNFTWSE